MTALMTRGRALHQHPFAVPDLHHGQCLGAWRPATMLGDTGDFSNTIYVGFPVQSAGDSLTPFLENDPVLGEVDEHFGGDYLNEETILKAGARRRLLDRRDRQARPGPDLRPHRAHRPADDHRRRRHRPPGGIPLSDEMKQAPRRRRSFPLQTPDAATTARPATARRPARRSPTSSSRTISPTSRPRPCCRCSRNATSRSSGLLVARPRRHAAQPGRQPRPAGAGHQRPDLARRDPERRRQSRRCWRR